MQKLFDKFDKVFCINLPHRTDRRESFISEVNKYDLGNFELIITGMVYQTLLL